MCSLTVTPPAIINNRLAPLGAYCFCRLTSTIRNLLLSSALRPPRHRLSLPRRFSALAMSRRPNFQGGRGRGGGGRGGGRGGGGGGRGEQRWWDPVWRAQRLGKQAAEMEVLNADEWWDNIQQFKRGGEGEMIIKRNFSRGDQEKLHDMASQLGLHFHAYNKGKALVVSKVPLPDYRADLDERHGSTQKEIRMSTETERRVGNFLQNSQVVAPAVNSASTSGQKSKEPAVGSNFAKPGSPTEGVKSKKLSIELKKRQEELKTSSSLKEMHSFREKLPAFKVRGEFLKAVEENQV